MYIFSRYDSPVGQLTLASDGQKLVGLWLKGQKYFAAGMDEYIIDAAPADDGHGVFAAAREWLARYFAGEAPSADELALAPAGTDFQKKVWRALCEIPYGQLTTYGGIAKKINSSPRAVGAAVGRNPISIIIPCHRVVGAGGGLTGYAGGLAAKKQLLELEK